MKTAIQLIEQIYSITQGTPEFDEHNEKMSVLEQAKRLEECVSTIDRLCRQFLASPVRETK